ncbi:hypothetical protein SGPA1_50162 [Streptomyces misionensis JCM 4497]
MPERPKGTVLKTVVAAMSPWVQIPPPPHRPLTRRSQGVSLDEGRPFCMGSVSPWSGSVALWITVCGAGADQKPEGGTGNLLLSGLGRLVWIKAARLRRAARAGGQGPLPLLSPPRSGGPHALSAQQRPGGQPEQEATRPLRAPGAGRQRPSEALPPGHSALPGRRQARVPGNCIGNARPGPGRGP